MKKGHINPELSEAHIEKLKELISTLFMLLLILWIALLHLLTVLVENSCLIKDGWINFRFFIIRRYDKHFIQPEVDITIGLICTAELLIVKR